MMVNEARQDFIDLIDETLQDSLGPDWNTSIGAKAIAAALIERYPSLSSPDWSVIGPELVEALNIARLFIEDQFRDDSHADDGEWLSVEARKPHSVICDALARAKALTQEGGG